MNIYGMFVANERRVPFWVTKWGAQVLRVTGVGELRGRPPYYGNPRVTGTVFSLYRDGERTQTFAPVENRDISAGTYNWVWVEPTDAQIEGPETGV